MINFEQGIVKDINVMMTENVSNITLIKTPEF